VHLGGHGCQSRVREWSEWGIIVGVVEEDDGRGIEETTVCCKCTLIRVCHDDGMQREVGAPTRCEGQGARGEANKMRDEEKG